MTASTGTTDFASTSDGLTQLRRHWPAEQPRAALLLVHGIGEHSGRYEHVGAFLAAHGIDTLAFDNRGFGQSGGRRAWVSSFDDYVADVEHLLAERRTLGVPLILMGHSLGGLIVSTYLVSRRPQPDLAILSAPALHAEVPKWQRVMAPLISRVAPTAFIKSKIEAELLSRDVAVQQAYVDDPLVFGGATAGLGNEIFSTMERTSAMLDRITLPTYVLHGADDQLVPAAASARLEALDNVARKVWSGLRHECLNEPEQAEVLAALQAWIDGQLSSSST